MARVMTKDERLAFLAEGTRTGMLSTVRADGRPHVAPVWFVPDGEELVLTTDATSVKGRNMARDPRVSLGVDAPRPPYDFVVVEGVASLSEDPAELLTWATRIAARYMGEERAREFGERNGVPGQLLVRIRPERVVAEFGVAD
ncbi:PPOX class F420-dependent oxidoreductase [Streptomyces litchfieldiae]|uniref:PPOX class F420-dependent oxidoreductase n=1 Tax=Streptomyces litchfieldiae TaxID=3075543 RepID=A0ABU2N0D1_9ACTN|nr:PPOX class F420-dependent oxidoreductase [Streptomyces sp. DSM 44938]MDT0347358.1 PPOX class F420-dependent oxidoreductase [Streptomyces sp. DSM 44938]